MPRYRQRLLRLLQGSREGNNDFAYGGGGTVDGRHRTVLTEEDNASPPVFPPSEGENLDTAEVGLNVSWELS